MENKKEKNWREIVKTDFDFGWKKWKGVPSYAELTLQFQRGDILDIGYATCQLYTFLRSKDWKKRYYGIDVQKYEGYEYPKSAELIIGDALKVEFPEVDTVVLYNILEYVDDPIILLIKAINSTRGNVEMWYCCLSPA